MYRAPLTDLPEDFLKTKKQKQTRQPAEISRLQLLDATEKLMIAEGYAAVTTRRVGADVGLTGALVHYYYPTTDDLLIAAYRRAKTRNEDAILTALQSKRPLHALWTLLTGTGHMALGLEFAALANHRKGIRSEITKRDTQSRKLQTRKLSQTISAAAATKIGLSPLGAVMLIEGMARAFAIDRNFGLSLGHKDARRFIEGILNAVEPARDTASKPRRSSGRKKPQE